MKWNNAKPVAGILLVTVTLVLAGCGSGDDESVREDALAELALATEAANLKSEMGRLVNKMKGDPPPAPTRAPPGSGPSKISPARSKIRRSPISSSAGRAAHRRSRRSGWPARVTFPSPCSMPLLEPGPSKTPLPQSPGRHPSPTPRHAVRPRLPPSPAGPSRIPRRPPLMWKSECPAKQASP